KCQHPWHFSFKWNGVHHRYSLDRVLGKRIETKDDALAAADDLRSKIRAGTFAHPSDIAPPTPPPAPTPVLTVRRLLDLYRKSKVEPKGQTAIDTFDGYTKPIAAAAVACPTGADVPFGDWAVNDVTLEACEKLRDVLAKRGKTGANRLMEKV